MEHETRMLVIRLLEEMAEGVRKGTFILNEKEGQTFTNLLQNKLENKPSLQICSIEVACAHIGISQPTFRKYVRMGLISEGIKVAGITERLWDKEEIRKFKKDYDSKKKRRKRV